MNTASISPMKNSHNILFMGQSNCGGFNQPAPDPATYPALKGQYIFEPLTATWQQLQQNKNNSGCPFGFLGFFGSELKLMQLMSDYYGSDQYMIKYAQGGTSLSADTADLYNWSPESTGDFMFKGSVINYHTAMANFPVQKITPKVMIWWQGEDDTDTVNAAAYQDNFSNYIAAFKNQCALPNLKIIQVGLSDNQTAYGSAGINQVNAAKRNLSIHGNKFVSTDGADVQSSGVHFSSLGYEDIAERLFDMVITML